MDSLRNLNPFNINIKNNFCVDHDEINIKNRVLIQRKYFFFLNRHIKKKLMDYWILENFHALWLYLVQIPFALCFPCGTWPQDALFRYYASLLYVWCRSIFYVRFTSNVGHKRCLWCDHQLTNLIVCPPVWCLYGQTMDPVI